MTHNNHNFITELLKCKRIENKNIKITLGERVFLVARYGGGMRLESQLVGRLSKKVKASLDERQCE